MNKHLAVLVAAWLVSAAAGAADLLSIYHDAAANDPQFASARASLDAGREKLPQGRAGLLPAVGLNANTTWNDEDYALRPAGHLAKRYNSNGWTVQLTQPLFRWQNWVAYTQSELAVAQAEAQFAQARQDLVLRVTQAYFDVLAAQEALATAQAQKAAISEQLEAAKRNFEVGTATITDTHEAQARHDLAEAQEIAAQSDLEVKRQALRSLIGKETEGLKNLKSGVGLSTPQPNQINPWVEQAETASPGVLVAQAGLEIAQREIERQRAGHLPTLDLVATRSHNAVNDGPFFGGYVADNRTVGLQLSVPLFAGGYTVSKGREAVALKEKAAADLENARRQAALAARQTYLGVTSGLAQVKALEAAYASSQSSLDSNKLGYEVGVRINIDVLNAQSQLYDTRQKLVRARLDTLLALLRLKAAAGSLGEEDLVAINALLE
ncbi:MAG: channel protein TolC [Betaproteobacteria bacterium HGW-Betaproteobacteria-11]|nr:MAG: channel protein TolC [Betaproteobacteria bacterium HGW-Betaproteobacteria-11]